MQGELYFSGRNASSELLGVFYRASSARCNYA